MTTSARKLDIYASVSPRKNEDGSKVKVVSDIVIRLGKRAIAFRTLGGKYTSEEALKEFKKNPNNWEVQPGSSTDELVFVSRYI